MAKPGKPSKDILPGTRIGFLTVLGKVRTPPRANGGQRYRVECVCGTRETVPRFYLMRAQPKTHCGCKDVKADEHLNYTKRSWSMMHQRCENKSHVAYHHYGGRGITICERWHKSNPKGFENFVADMGLRPYPDKAGVWSLDRWPNNDGNYEPGNTRWATGSQQRYNQRGMPLQGDD